MNNPNFETFLSSGAAQARVLADAASSLPENQRAFFLEFAVQALDASRAAAELAADYLKVPRKRGWTLGQSWDDLHDIQDDDEQRWLSAMNAALAVPLWLRQATEQGHQAQRRQLMRGRR